jgi:hypothetical protein
VARKGTDATKLLSDVEAVARAEAYRRAESERASKQAAEAREFMSKNNLHSTADCVALARKTVKSMTCTGVDAGAHWRKVLANPKACYAAREMATAALKRIASREDEEPAEGVV